MFEWSYEITQFLPIKIEDQHVSEYISYHSKKLDESIEHNIETWVFLHTHILYMTFIYIQLLRISENKEKEFKYSRIGLPSNEKTFIKNDTISPFSFSGINEKTVFRFFRLLDFDDGTIGNISACVNERNDLLHATGNNFENLDQKIAKYINNMENIINKSKDFIQELYQWFINDNPTLLEEWYVIDYNDLETNLFSPYYVSEYESKKLIRRNKEDKITKELKDLFW